MTGGAVGREEAGDGVAGDAHAAPAAAAEGGEPHRRALGELPRVGAGELEPMAELLERAEDCYTCLLGMAAAVLDNDSTDHADRIAAWLALAEALHDRALSKQESAKLRFEQGRLAELTGDASTAATRYRQVRFGPGEEAEARGPETRPPWRVPGPARSQWTPFSAVRGPPIRGGSGGDWAVNTAWSSAAPCVPAGAIRTSRSSPSTCRAIRSVRSFTVQPAPL